MATSQMFIFSSGNFPKDKLGPLGPSALGWGKDWLGGWALRLEQARGPSAVAMTYLGNCSLENCKFGKLPLRKIPLQEVAAWKKVFGKVPNITWNYVFKSICYWKSNFHPIFVRILGSFFSVPKSEKAWL